jgi:hypothetical protein
MSIYCQGCTLVEDWKGLVTCSHPPFVLKNEQGGTVLLSTYFRAMNASDCATFHTATPGREYSTIKSFCDASASPQIPRSVLRETLFAR